MPVDIQKLFNNDLPATLAKNPEAAKKFGAKYQINITGEGGGEWFVNVSDSGPKVEKGTPGSADVVMTISSADFQQYLADPQVNHQQLYFAGKLTVTGNPMLSLKLPSLFSR